MKVKFLLFAALMLIFSVDAAERESLISGDVTHGGFGGPLLKATQIDGDINYMVGGRGAWLLNHQFFLGGAGYGTVQEIGNHGAELGYGGVWAGMKFNPSKLVHYSVDVLVGAGGLTKDYTSNNSSNTQHSDDKLFIIEPGANLNINIASYAELVLSLSYRLVNGSSHQTLSDSDLSGASITASVMFGRF